MRPLILAVNYGHNDIVRLLLESGADLKFRDELGHCALDYAVLRGQVKLRVVAVGVGGIL
jgi:ankyrin repeat protein